MDSAIHSPRNTIKTHLALKFKQMSFWDVILKLIPKSTNPYPKINLLCETASGTTDTK